MKQPIPYIVVVDFTWILFSPIGRS